MTLQDEGRLLQQCHQSVTTPSQLADVVVCTATGPMARTAFATALLRGSHVQRPDVVGTRASEVTFSGSPVDLDADGEIEDGVTSRTWRVTHQAWSVIVPP